MRHLWSFLAGVVVAPITWILVALGQDGSERTIDRWVEVGTFNTANLIEPAVYLGVAGVLLGLIGTLRVSPLGPLVAGLLLVGLYAGVVVAPFELRDRVPADWRLLGDPLPLWAPLENGTLLLVGVALLMAVVSGQRWRRWPAAPTELPAAGPDGTEDAEFALTDPQPGDAGEHDTAPPTLGYPDGPDPLPRRTPGSSPWSKPPRATAQQDSTAS